MKKSKIVRRGSESAATKAAKAAFAATSTLRLAQNLDSSNQQKGRRRLENTYWIELDRIRPDPKQPRKEFNPQQLGELTASIRERGVKEPLTVRWDESNECWTIIDGERRYRAAKELQLKELPCWVQESAKQDVLIDQIVHNWQRSKLQPCETAAALARLRDEFELNGKQLSEMTGKPKSEISKLLAIHDKVSPEVKKLAQSKDNKTNLSRRQLYAISQLPQEKQLAVANQACGGKESANETEECVAMQRHAHKKRKHRTNERSFKTSVATVFFKFHEGSPTNADIAHALAEVSAQVLG